MWKFVLALVADIHRHTGGLEMSPNKPLLTLIIHRHTGGLENILAPCD